MLQALSHHHMNLLLVGRSLERIEPAARAGKDLCLKVNALKLDTSSLNSVRW
jgi:short-subunit dehydrogenase